MRFCKDCKWYRQADGMIYRDAMCMRPMGTRLDLVQGYVIPNPPTRCEDERKDSYGQCGHFGTFWESSEGKK